MIKPKKNTFIYRFFCWYIARIIKQNFNALDYNTIEIEADKSVLLLANHYSWWDGFVLFYLNKIYFKKNFYVMIMENTAKQIWFMKYLGAFSVLPHSRSVLRSLQFAGELLNKPTNLVLIFPQGKLHSSYINKLVFQKGLVKVIEASKKEFQFLFSASFTDYFAHKKPTLRIYLKTQQASNLATLAQIENAYNQHYQAALHTQAGISI
jgi:1-acyl-sn-glycerol-3-phosphate acyltransferase